MGSRGAFQDVDTGKFNFVENGQNYHTVGDVDGVQVILQNSGSVNCWNKNEKCWYDSKRLIFGSINLYIYIRTDKNIKIIL